MIKEIMELCSRPSAACNYMLDHLNDESFVNEVDLGNALIEIDTETDEDLRDLFTERWVLRFYPENLAEALFARNELLELGDGIRERNALANPVYQAADEYLKNFNDLLDHLTKYGYDNMPSYMIVYKNDTNHPINVFTVKPTAVTDFLIDAKKRHRISEKI